MNLTIIEAQKKVDEHIKKNEKGYWKPLELLAAIIEELGEVSRSIMALDQIKPKKKNEKLKNIDEELGDLLYSFICLANYYNIDLDSSLISTIEKYTIRDKERWINKK